MTTLEIILIVALIYLVMAIVLICISCYTAELIDLEDVLMCLAWGIVIWIQIPQMIQRKIKRKREKEE